MKILQDQICSVKRPMFSNPHHLLRTKKCTKYTAAKQPYIKIVSIIILSYLQAVQHRTPKLRGYASLRTGNVSARRLKGQWSLTPVLTMGEDRGDARWIMNGPAHELQHRHLASGRNFCPPWRRLVKTVRCHSSRKTDHPLLGRLSSAPSALFFLPQPPLA